MYSGLEEGVVYLLLAQPSGRVKLGFSTKLEQRIREHQCAAHEQLALIAAVPGCLGDERDLHSALADVRVRGEWYESLTAVIDRLAAVKTRRRWAAV